MRCPNPSCSKEQSKVIDSRPREESIYRRRECKGCGYKYTTHEHVHISDLTVVKSTGEREPFSREKLFDSLKIALKNCPITEDRIDRSTSTIQQILEKMPAKEVPSKEIGKMAMEKLAQLNEVGYVRFTSVHKAFVEAKDFEKLVGTLQR